MCVRESLFKHLFIPLYTYFPSIVPYRGIRRANVERESGDHTNHSAGWLAVRVHSHVCALHQLLQRTCISFLSLHICVTPWSWLLSNSANHNWLDSMIGPKGGPHEQRSFLRFYELGLKREVLSFSVINLGNVS